MLLAAQCLSWLSSLTPHCMTVFAFGIFLAWMGHKPCSAIPLLRNLFGTLCSSSSIVSLHGPCMWTFDILRRLPVCSLASHSSSSRKHLRSPTDVLMACIPSCCWRCVLLHIGHSCTYSRLVFTDSTNIWQVHTLLNFSIAHSYMTEMLVIMDITYDER